MSTRQQARKAGRTSEEAARPGRLVRKAGRGLLRATLWLPPLFLGAMLIAGPVSASIGTPTAVAVLHHGAPAADAHAASVTSCAATIQPLPAVAVAGPTGAPQGPGRCFAPAAPSSAPGGATSIAPNTQVVTQSIGMEVRPG